MDALNEQGTCPRRNRHPRLMASEWEINDFSPPATAAPQPGEARGTAFAPPLADTTANSAVHVMSLRVMVVDSDVERVRHVVNTLQGAGYDVSAVVRDNADLYREVKAHAPDVIIVSMDAPGRDTLEHIQSISANQPRPIVMFSQSADQETIRAAIQSGVSAYIVDGLQAQRLKPILDVAIAQFREIQALRLELQQTKATLAERKTIERAKGLLMKHRNLSEEEAHAALRKMAMSRNKKLIEIAEGLIAAFDLLA